MSSIHYAITIKAPKEKVWNTMLQQETYRIWTAEFGEGCYYEGSWEQGKKIRFLGADGSGGMTSVIAENQPYRYLSIKHLGVVKDGIETRKARNQKRGRPHTRITPLASAMTAPSSRLKCPASLRSSSSI